MTLETNTQIDRYRILESKTANSIISEYYAEDIQTKETITLRLFLEARETSDSFVAEFDRIAEHLHELEHPGIEKIIHYGHSVFGSFLVCEDLDANPLRTISLPIPAKEAAQILLQASSALEYLHGHEIIHGNLSLENILLYEDRHVKICNFGFDTLLRRELAWSMPDSYILLSMSNPALRSPEQTTGKEASTASDIYAIGAIFFELLAGIPPFAASSPVETALLKDIITVGWPEKMPGKLPYPAIQLVHRCVTVDPAQRFSKMVEVSKVLARLSEGKPARVRVTREMMVGAPKKAPWLLLAILILLIASAGGLFGYYQFSYLPTLQSSQSTAVSAGLTAIPSTSATSTIPPTSTDAPTATPTLTPTNTPTPTATPKPTFQATLGVRNFISVKLINKISFQSEVQRAIEPPGVAALVVKDVLVFSPDSHYLAASGLRQRTVVFETKGLANILSGEGWIPPGDPFAPDNLSVLLVRGLTPKTLGIFTMAGDYKPIGEYFDEAAVDFVYNGTLIVAARDNQMRLWDVASGLEIDLNQGPEYGCRVARAAHNAEFLAAYSAAGIYDQWDETIRTNCQNSNKAIVKSSSDTKKLGYVNANGLIEIYNTVSRNMIWRELIKITSIEFSVDGKLIAAGLPDGSVVVWDADTGARLAQLTPGGFRSITAIRFSPDNKMIAFMDGRYNVALYGLFVTE